MTPVIILVRRDFKFMKMVRNRLHATFVIVTIAITFFGCHGTLPTGNETITTIDSGGVITPSGLKSDLSFVYETIDTLFSLHVDTSRGLVDYDGIHADPRLRSLIDTIAEFDMSGLEYSAESLAFWINAYNVTVIYYLEKEFGRRRQDQIGFPLFNTKYRIARELITLDELEKKHSERISKFREPRTHFALVCAALSCPPLMNSAFRHDRLWSQLEQRTRNFINDRRFNPIPQVSQLFSWYSGDFSGWVRDPTAVSLSRPSSYGTARDFVTSYLHDTTAITGKELSFVVYDWSINDWNK